ncbi:MAG: glycosyltransferase [Lachnospiraceae bacterium]|nr:glycosyltransferase [Lachnospiraceae bacterium]
MSISIIPALRGTNIPYIISERNDPMNFAGKKITKFLYQLCMKNANGVVFQTKDVQKYYKGRINGKNRVIYNPLIIEEFPDNLSDKKNKTIVTVGRLHPQKNQQLLIKAFYEVYKKYPEYRLEIYGEGESRKELETLINRLNMQEHIFLMGVKPNVLEYVNRAEIFVLSSNYEGMPNSLIEALALGIPCVSTNCPCGGPRELIHDHVNGSLVPVNDKTMLVAALVELISKPQLRNQYSKESIKIRETLAGKRIFEEWRNFCEEISGDIKK